MSVDFWLTATDTRVRPSHAADIRAAVALLPSGPPPSYLRISAAVAERVAGLLAKMERADRRRRRMARKQRRGWA